MGYHCQWFEYASWSWLCYHSWRTYCWISNWQEGSDGEQNEMCWCPRLSHQDQVSSLGWSSGWLVLDCLLESWCLFVRSQNSGVQVRSSTDEHVKVRSMFDKMAKIWELIKNLLPYLCDSAHVDCWNQTTAQKLNTYSFILKSSRLWYVFIKPCFHNVTYSTIGCKNLVWHVNIFNLLLMPRKMTS